MLSSTKRQCPIVTALVYLVSTFNQCVQRNGFIPQANARPRVSLDRNSESVGFTLTFRTQQLAPSDARKPDMILGKDVLLTKRRGLNCILTLNRPERCNVFSVETADCFAKERRSRVAIVRRRRHRFCTHHDLKEVVEGDVRGGTLRAYKPHATRRASPDLPNCTTTLTVIDGYRMAGGRRPVQY